MKAETTVGLAATSHKWGVAHFHLRCALKGKEGQAFCARFLKKDDAKPEWKLLGH